MTKLYDLFERLNQAKNQDTLWQEICSAFSALGYDKTVFIQGSGKSTHFARANFSEEFSASYKNHQLMKVDPFVQICLKSPLPMRTGMNFLEHYPTMTEAQREFAYYVGEAGLKSGLSVPLPLMNRHYYGGWNLGGDLSRKESIEVLAEHETDLQLLAYYAYQCLQTAEAPKVNLSPREYDCLCHVAQGKNNQQISDALFISKSTVEYHINNIRKKLGAKNRTHTVALAIKYQLIQPML